MPPPKSVTHESSHTRVLLLLALLVDGRLKHLNQVFRAPGRRCSFSSVCSRCPIALPPHAPPEEAPGPYTPGFPIFSCLFRHFNPSRSWSTGEVPLRDTSLSHHRWGVTAPQTGSIMSPVFERQPGAAIQGKKRPCLYRGQASPRIGEIAHPPCLLLLEASGRLPSRAPPEPYWYISNRSLRLYI